MRCPGIWSSTAVTSWLWHGTWQCAEDENRLLTVYEATRPSCLAVIGGLVAVPFFGAEPACDSTGREVLGSRGCRDVASWYHLSGLPFAPGPGYVQLQYSEGFHYCWELVIRLCRHSLAPVW